MLPAASLTNHVCYSRPQEVTGERLFWLGAVCLSLFIWVSWWFVTAAHYWALSWGIMNSYQDTFTMTWKFGTVCDNPGKKCCRENFSTPGFSGWFSPFLAHACSQWCASAKVHQYITFPTDWESFRERGLQETREEAMDPSHCSFLQHIVSRSMFVCE